MEAAKEIYAAELILNQTNANTKEAVFLDLKIVAAETRQFRIFNKMDEFPFKVVRYGFSDSNVHSSMGANIFFSQLTRFIRITNRLKDFEGRVSEMFQNFIVHGYERSKLQSKFLLFVQKNKPRLSWLGASSNLEIMQLVDRIFLR